MTDDALTGEVLTGEVLTDDVAAEDVPADTRRRCGWATSAPDYLEYHDQEWGTTVRGDDALFERMSLEAFQAGLSWITILRKRPAFRQAFAGFEIAEVARFDDHDVARLMADVAIVRNSHKIQAVISNARVALGLDGGLDRLLWSFAPASHRTPADPSAVPAVTPESTAMAKALKQRGFRFVGPTTAYALMQATGMVDDHVAYCWRAPNRRSPVGGRGRR
nr:DNA-3-methyladenine glycosylase I [Nakamurella sp. PAMC28650]